MATTRRLTPAPARARTALLLALLVLAGLSPVLLTAAPAAAASPNQPPFTLYLPIPVGTTVSAGYPHQWDATSGAWNSLDFAGEGGLLSVHAAAPGTATVVNAPPWMPNCAVFIDHGNGWQTGYYHLRDIVVTSGQQVVAGQHLGWAGLPGTNTCGTGDFTHLHFGLFRNGTAVDVNDLSIGGYTVHSNGNMYCGWWTRNSDGATVVPNDCFVQPSLVNNQLVPSGGGNPGGGGGGGPGAADPARYTPVTPARVLDTRTGNGAPAGKLSAGQTLTLQVSGRGGIPSGASGVVANVTVTDPNAAGFLTAFPCDATLPLASNVNFTPGQTVPNLVSARLDPQGRLCLYASAPTHVVVDVAGSFGVFGSLYNPVDPTRFLDTRTGNGAPAGKLLAGQSLTLQVTGRFGLPGGATGAVANVTVTEPEAAGHLTVYPCDTSPPVVSNLNYTPGQTVPNLVNVRLDAQGRVCLTSHATTHVVVDLAGLYYADIGVRFTPMTPVRVIDSRNGTGGLAVKLDVNQVLQWPVAGFSGVASNATGVVANVTVTDPEGAGYLTVYPCGASPPLASNLNFVAGQTVPNLVSARLDAQGRACLVTTARTHLVIDVAGYHAP